MNSKIHLTITIGSLTLVALVLPGFALLSRAQAVVPAPDGGYLNFTTAEGTNALQNLTTGAGNTGVGWYSLFTDTTASFNTGLGVGTLLFTTRIQIPSLALQRFYSTPPVMEIRPLASARCRAIPKASRTQPSAKMRS
jgi:hypothetical protein